MARYVYRCHDCDHTFEVRESISEHRTDSHPAVSVTAAQETPTSIV